MHNRPWTVSLVVIAVAAVMLSTSVPLRPQSARGDEQPLPVAVVNFPETQNVEGRVGVTGVVAHARQVRIVNQVVPPVDRGATSDLIEAGVLDADGFTAAVLSLQGELRGTLGQAGPVGALLIPDDEEILELFDRGKIHFPLEVTTTLNRKEITTFEAQAHLAVGFPRYRVYLYNSTDRGVDVDLFVYLTN